MTYNFRHFLNFLDLPNVGKIEVSEPFGFDGSSFMVEQDSKRYGRDVFIFNETIELEFNRELFERITTPQQLIDGTPIAYASQGFDFILDVINNEGWNGRIEYIIEIDGNEFVTGIFDLFTAIIEDNAVKVKIIQDTAREKLKRNSDVVIDAFSDKDLDENSIAPCNTVDILLKAKPTFQKSKINVPQETDVIFNKVATTDAKFVFNFINGVIDYGVQNTLSFIQGGGTSTNPSGASAIAEDFNYIVAINSLANVTVNLQYTIKLDAIQVPLETTNTLNGGSLRSYYYKGNTFNYSNRILLNTEPTSGFTETVSKTLQFDTNLEIGDRLWIWFEFIPANESTILRFYRVTTISGEVNVSATATGIDSVIKGVRLIDLFKHNVKATCGLDLSAPIYDVNGEHYDNFATNGYLLGQVTDKPFNNKFKDLMEILSEQNADYQVNTNNVEILPYEGFYTNNEIFVAEELPDHTSTSAFNKRYFLNTAEVGFKSSSKGRETNGQNTIDDVHGKTQWKFPSTLTDGNLKVDFGHIRSAFLIEEQRKRVTEAKQGTSLQYDDNLFLLDVVRLAPSTQRSFGATLLMNILDNGHLQILNNNTNGDLGNFNWGLLGFGVGAQFFIDSGENVGQWQVWSIEPSILELFPISTSASFSGEAFIEVRYFLNNVLYTNRTNEGFSEISGIENANDYSNLRYSFKRILQKWHSYFATATKFDRTGEIKNTMFETNSGLVTRLIGEPEAVVDVAPIDVNDIRSKKILNPITHDISVFADFQTVLNFVNDVQNVKGFGRFLLNNGKVVKGYPTKLDYELATQKLEVTIEEKYESDVMEITTIGSDILINGVVYALSNFRLNDIWVQFFDANDIAINNPVRFTNVSVNGVVYDNETDFSDALLNILI